ncbi:hypothetical protein COOONC_28085 [Cooperia oncophora]
MDTIESREREQSRLRPDIDSSSSEDGGNDDESDGRGAKTCAPRCAISDVIAEEEAECRKYVYIGQAVDSHADLKSMRSEHRPTEPIENNRVAPVRPPRPGRETSANDLGMILYKSLFFGISADIVEFKSGVMGVLQCA